MDGSDCRKYILSLTSWDAPLRVPEQCARIRDFRVEFEPESH